MCPCQCTQERCIQEDCRACKNQNQKRVASSSCTCCREKLMEIPLELFQFDKRAGFTMVTVVHSGNYPSFDFDEAGSISGFCIRSILAVIAVLLEFATVILNSVERHGANSSIRCYLLTTKKSTHLEQKKYVRRTGSLGTFTEAPVFVCTWPGKLH